MASAVAGEKGVTGRSAILTYHSLDETGSPISITPSMFRRQMKALDESGIAVVPLGEIRHRPGSIAITFDDGFLSFLQHAFPVLEQFGFPATVFVVSGYCGGRNDWPSQPAGIPRLPLMDWRTLRELPSRVSLGAHTVSHPDLRSVDDIELSRQVRESRAEIEQQTGRQVESFAYPYGAADHRATALVRREFSLACGTLLDFAGPDSDAALLPRLDAYYLKSVFRLRNPLGLTNTAYIGVRRWMREARTCTGAH